MLYERLLYKLSFRDGQKRSMLLVRGSTMRWGRRTFLIATELAVAEIAPLD